MQMVKHVVRVVAALAIALALPPRAAEIWPGAG